MMNASSHRLGCGGPGSWAGPCGAIDCPDCHPEYQRTCPVCGWRGYVEPDEDGGRTCPQCGDGEPRR